MNEPSDLKKVFEFEFSHFGLCLTFQLRKTFLILMRWELAPKELDLMVHPITTPLLEMGSYDTLGGS